MEKSGPVIGYKIYCFPGDSQNPEIIKNICDNNNEYFIISGLKPNQLYRVGMGSVTTDTRSRLVFTREHVRTGKMFNGH